MTIGGARFRHGVRASYHARFGDRLQRSRLLHVSCATPYHVFLSQGGIGGTVLLHVSRLMFRPTSAIISVLLGIDAGRQRAVPAAIPSASHIPADGRAEQKVAGTSKATWRGIDKRPEIWHNVWWSRVVRARSVDVQQHSP